MANLLSRAYGLVPTELVRGPAGTATHNLVATEDDGRRWFVKVYPETAEPDDEREALELSEFARNAGVPVPMIRRTVTGDLLAESDGAALSVAAYVEDARTAEGGLTGDLWAAVGEIVGRLHRILAEHPAGSPRVVPGREVCDVELARQRLELLLARSAERGLDAPDTAFARWAVATAQRRLDQLPSTAALLRELPDGLTVQVVHGDLASPNVLVRGVGAGSEVAALIDFRPPGQLAAAWELGRIVLDPRTVLARSDWPSGLATAVAAYREANPALPVEDLLAVPRVAAGYLACTVYPLSVPFRAPDAVTDELAAYGRARHEALGVLCARLDEAEQLLGDLLLRPGS